MSISTYLTDNETVLRRSLGTKNDYGEAAETWTTVTTTLKGTIQQHSGDTARDESGQAVTADAVLYCLAGSNIQVGDKVLDPSGVTWNVLGVINASNRNHHYKVLLRLIK